MTEQLKPCPFCGKNGEMHKRKIGFSVLCGNENCGNAFTNFHKNEIYAINQWNTRADGWVSVDDQLPEIGQECLIEIPVCGKFNLENGKYKGEGIWVGAWCDFRGKGCNYKVNRWMPLPSKPAK